MSSSYSYLELFLITIFSSQISIQGSLALCAFWIFIHIHIDHIISSLRSKSCVASGIRLLKSQAIGLGPLIQGLGRCVIIYWDQVVIFNTFSGFKVRVWRTYSLVVFPWFSHEGFHVNIKCYLYSAPYYTCYIILTIRGIFVILTIHKNWVKSDKIYSSPFQINIEHTVICFKMPKLPLHQTPNVICHRNKPIKLEELTKK